MRTKKGVDYLDRQVSIAIIQARPSYACIDVSFETTRRAVLKSGLWNKGYQPKLWLLV